MASVDSCDLKWTLTAWPALLHILGECGFRFTELIAWIKPAGFLERVISPLQ